LALVGCHALCTGLFVCSPRIALFTPMGGMAHHGNRGCTGVGALCASLSGGREYACWWQRGLRRTVYTTSTTTRIWREEGKNVHRASAQQATRARWAQTATTLLEEGRGSRHLEEAVLLTSDSVPADRCSCARSHHAAASPRAPVNPLNRASPISLSCRDRHGFPQPCLWRTSLRRWRCGLGKGRGDRQQQQTRREQTCPYPGRAFCLWHNATFSES
jgi:hypothetical protein